MNSIYLISIIVSIISLNNANLNEKLQQFQQVNNALCFKDKVVLITGSGNEVGAETARLFCHLGAQVVITDCDENRVRTVAGQCQQLTPNKYKILGVVADITKDADINRLVSDTIKHYGKVDILVNAAKINIHSRVTDKNYLEVFEKVTNLNLRAALHLANLLVPYLKQTNGTILNLAGIGAKFPAPTSSAYIASKAAMVQVSRTLAVELGPCIRVNSISPGLLPGTQVAAAAEAVNPQIMNKVNSKTPMGRHGCPLDIAKAIVFFASPLAQWITGQNLDVDGGFYGDFGLPQNM